MILMANDYERYALEALNAAASVPEVEPIPEGASAAVIDAYRSRGPRTRQRLDVTLEREFHLRRATIYSNLAIAAATQEAQMFR